MNDDQPPSASPVTLEAHLASGKLFITAEIVRLGSQLSQQIETIHQQGRVLGNLSLASIVLERGTDGRLQARLSDGGSATGQLMSPEQAAGLPTDFRSDLYQLGCVLYTLCTRRLPDTGEIKPIEQINPNTPLALIAIIERLMARAPADRFPSAAVVTQRLGQLTSATKLPAIDDLELAVAEDSDPAREKAKQIVLALVALIAMLLLVWLLLSFFGPKKSKKTSAPPQAITG